jgi:hypothetical protein
MAFNRRKLEKEKKEKEKHEFTSDKAALMVIIIAWIVFWPLGLLLTFTTFFGKEDKKDK